MTRQLVITLDLTDIDHDDLAQVLTTYTDRVVNAANTYPPTPDDGYTADLVLYDRTGTITTGRVIGHSTVTDTPPTHGPAYRLTLTDHTDGTTSTLFPGIHPDNIHKAWAQVRLAERAVAALGRHPEPDLTAITNRTTPGTWTAPNGDTWTVEPT